MPSEKEPLLVIVDNHRMRQEGIVSIISEWAAQQGLEIIQIPTSSLLAQFGQSATCRLVLFSVGGESLESGEAGSIVRVLTALAPHAQVVVISDRDDPDQILFAYRAGCHAYIPTSMEPSLALEAMHFVLSGGSYFPPSVLQFAAPQSQTNGDNGPGNEGRGDDGPTGEPSPNGDGQNGLVPSCDETGVHSADVADLTKRQHDVLLCLQRGLPNKLIARELRLTEGTVKVHVRQIMRKLGALNRTQVALLFSATERATVGFHIRGPLASVQ